MEVQLYTPHELRLALIQAQVKAELPFPAKSARKSIWRSNAAVGDGDRTVIPPLS